MAAALTVVRRHRNRRAIAACAVAALAAPAAAALGAAGGDGPQAGAAQQPRQGGTLTVLSAGDVDSLDPGITYTTFGASLAAATQRTLLSYRPDTATTPVPDLAAAPPQVAADGRSVTVTLRPGIRFSPPVNRAVTSRDVKYAIERGFFRTVASPYAALYFGDLLGARPGAAPGTVIPGLETPNDQTLVLRLARPRGGLVAAALVMTLTAPVPLEYAAGFDRANPSTYGRHEVATGPYMVQNDAQGNTVGYRPRREILLVRNPNWVAATDLRPARLDRIDVREGNTDTSSASRRVLSGRGLISGDFGVESRVLQRELPRRRAQVAFVLGGSVGFETLNTKLAPFDDVDVRRAVVAGYDRAAAQRLAGGSRLAGPLATHFIPPGVPGFREAGGFRGPRLAMYASPSGSVRRARFYLRRAGFRSGRYTGRAAIVVVTVTDPAARRGDRLLRRNLNRLGFPVRFRRLEPDRAFAVCSNPRSRVHICGGGFTRDFADPETIISPLFNGASISPVGNSNVSQLDDPAVNRAIRAAQTLSNPDERARAWARIDRQVTALAPAVAVGWPRFAMIRSADVAGVPSQIYSGLWDLSFTALR
jgi:peptide/nickel transport system substrate-binding protein